MMRVSQPSIRVSSAAQRYCTSGGVLAHLLGPWYWYRNQLVRMRQ